MYDDTVKSNSIDRKCKCKVGTHCGRTDCDCGGMCEIFEGQMADILTWNAVTVSPDPRTIEDYDQLQTTWQNRFTKLLPHIEDCIIVLELAGLRPHYHCVFKVKDKVGFNIKLLNWSRHDNIKKHNMFKDGLHYLFKDVDKTYDETKIIPILLHDDLIETKLQQKLNRQRKLISHDIFCLDERPYPKWMTDGGESD